MKKNIVLLVIVLLLLLSACGGGSEGERRDVTFPDGTTLECSLIDEQVDCDE